MGHELCGVLRKTKLKRLPSVSRDVSCIIPPFLKFFFNMSTQLVFALHQERSHVLSVSQPLLRVDLNSSKKQNQRYLGFKT